MDEKMGYELLHKKRNMLQLKVFSRYECKSWKDCNNRKWNKDIKKLLLNDVIDWLCGKKKQEIY